MRSGGRKWCEREGKQAGEGEYAYFVVKNQLWLLRNSGRMVGVDCLID